VYTLTATWNGTLDETHPDALTAQTRAQAILAEHPNATVKIEGPGFSATVGNPTPPPATA
jgi:hypothetical protein